MYWVTIHTDTKYSALPLPQVAMMTTERYNYQIPHCTQSLSMDSTQSNDNTYAQTHSGAFTIEKSRKVPRNLIQSKEINNNIAWARENYHYRHLFESEQVGITPTCDEDCIQWSDKDLSLHEDLMKAGYIAAQNEIVRVARSYCMMLPNNQAPTSLQDVLDIIGYESWYRKTGEKMEKNWDIIFMLAYEIYRAGFNDWALKEARNWMNTYHISYADMPLNRNSTSGSVMEQAKARRTGKGFVYKILVSRASDQISKRIQKMMKAKYNEFLLVRHCKKTNPHVNYTRRNIGMNHYTVATIMSSGLIGSTFWSAEMAARSSLISKETLLGIVDSIYDRHDTSRSSKFFCLFNVKYHTLFEFRIKYNFLSFSYLHFPTQRYHYQLILT